MSGTGFLDGQRCNVDILKLPHHGSERNVKPEFFEKVWADHYVISANGKHGNPDIGTLRMLSDARTDDGFTLHLTNRTGKEGLGDKLKKFFADEKANGRRYKVKYRRKTAGSFKIDLLDKVTY